MIAAILAAALHTSPAVVLRTAPGARNARYVRLHMTVIGYGMPGSATLLVDRERARYIEHFDLGPQSFYQGFDGMRAWQADATGTTAIQGNSIDRSVVRAWGDLFAFDRPADAGGSVKIDPATRALRFSMWNGSANEIATFSSYQTFPGGTIAPRSIVFTDDNGTWNARVTRIDTPAVVTAGAFSPPRAARDASIAGGQTSVPFLVATEIVIPVRIDNGPVMHFILDTGGQNILTTQSVKQLGLHPIGHGTVGGAGAGVIPTRFLTVRSVRVGRAEMRNQPFIVIDSSILRGIDGIVGFELLSRFAARIDYRTNTLTLASSLPKSWIAGVTPTPFVFRSRAPQIDGSIDAFPGALIVDTGNSGVLDVNAPFAIAHDLWTYYHAKLPKKGSLVGVGGAVNTSNIVVKKLRLGSAILENVHGDLTQASAGVEANPSFAAGVGEGVFRNFTFVLDYAHQRLFFAPGGIRDMSGVDFTLRGDRIVVQAVHTRLARAAGVRAGMTLTSVDGRAVNGRDLAAVRAELQDREPGTTVEVIFDGTKRVKLTFLNYL
jgi:hypothetical protein